MIKKYVLREKKRHISESALQEVLRYPVVTEKSISAKSRGEYFFAVASWANKIVIARAVESFFGVKVKSVNTLHSRKKKCRFRGKEGVRTSVKRAIVSLQEGSDLSLDLGGGDAK
jgi:large subunit ribosomal protein L23